MTTRLLISLLVASLLVPSIGQSADLDPQQLEFFEKKIRPVLVNQCYRCHSSESNRLKGELRVDTKGALRKGGLTGPAIVPGHPEKSLLIQALKYQKLQMPPKGKLPQRVIDDFVHWVKKGAIDPRTGNTKPTTNAINFEKARQHWAFRPLQKPSIPQVNNDDWSETIIDKYILNRLNQVGVKPAPMADRRTLIRRLYYDLIGLPPTWEQVRAFEQDPSPNAWTKVVDELLASPQYGEHWGRHWLDVARFAETKDLVLLYGKDRIRPYAYTYRDYVVRAFNQDTPYDQFILEQLAADQLTLKDNEQWRLAAMGFLTLGRLFDNNLPDVYDDQIDTVTRGFLGLTVSCARCHDHKYDAIPTADYYSLYGIFANSEKPIDLPLIENPANIPGGEDLEKKLQAERQELQKHIDSQYKSINEIARARVSDYLVHIVTTKPDPLEEGVFFLSLSPDDLKPQMVARWRRFLESRSTQDPIFGLWLALMDLPETELSTKASILLEQWSSKEVNPQVRQALTNATIRSRADVARAYGQAFLKAWKTKNELAPGQKALREILTGKHSPFYFPRYSTYQYMPRVERGKYHGKLLELDKLAIHAVHAPARAMVLADSPEINPPRIFVRGNPLRPGKVVPRRFLQLLSSKKSQTFSKGSGRLELAQAIISDENPLMARVMVNRVWMHHFGQPLVNTPNDFGVRSNEPTHPELLDALAWGFRANDYSLKRLHRLVVLSSVYQQASNRFVEKDRDNHWLSHMNRRRLTLEQMRDSLLHLAGNLDLEMSGRSVNLITKQSHRRTIYGLVDRQDVPGLYRAFDFPTPDQSTGKRPQTTVPQQALFATNSPFVIGQVQKLVARLKQQRLSNQHANIRWLYHTILHREPDERELVLGERFVQASQSTQSSKLSRLEQYVHVLLLTNEFMFID